jgi:hypothetical protein
MAMNGGRIPNAKMEAMLLGVVCGNDCDQTPSYHPDTGTKLQLALANTKFVTTSEFRIKKKPRACLGQWFRLLLPSGVF